VDVRIFLSSISVDLGSARERILKLLSVIPAELVHMETFGSDETRPVDYSLGQVRKCNLFVGIYAERYGTVDPKTGKSVTELEYHEARRMLNAGRLKGLLVYMLDSAAAWKVEHVDREAANVRGLTSLKAEIKQNHTVTFFSDVDALSLSILKDILRKIGIGTRVAFRPREVLASMPSPRRGPLGMEHYTERDAAIFRGRESDVASLCELVETHPLVLLIGDSGIGKTSLIQAGVAPALRKKGWFFGSCRPLDDPDRTISTTLWLNLMEGVPPDENITTVFDLIASAYGDQKILIVVDQFEDIMPKLGTKTTQGLLNALALVHNAPRPNLRVVVCYRGDAEPKVGTYWQAVSGSASGLPRFYLGPMSHESSRAALTEMVYGDNKVSEKAEIERFVAKAVDDIRAESLQSVGVEIYPPFLQMVAEAVAKNTADENTPPNVQLYESLGGAREIIGQYLANQLKVLGPRSKECRLILVSLASRQRRLRKSVEEIAEETSVRADLIDTCLSDLTNLRLIRPIESSWEIVHDFLAKKVFEELIAPEDREARLFRDVLVAKAAAYEKTGELLNFKEHLGVYAHRSRIPCTPQEVQLLFVSSLAGNGPVEFFLRSVPAEYPEAWAGQQIAVEESPLQENAYRFLTRHGKTFSLGTLAGVFGDYKLQSELAGWIRQFANRDDIDLLLKLRRKKAELTREAADETVEQIFGPSDCDLMKRLLRSPQSRDIRLACRTLASHSSPAELGEYRVGVAAGSQDQRVASICGLGACGTWSDIRMLVSKLNAKQTQAKEKEVCAHAIALWAQRNDRPGLLRKLLLGQTAVCRGALGALEGHRGGLSVRLLLQQQRRLPNEVAQAVRRTAKSGDVRVLKRFLRGVHLDQSMRDILLSLLSAGGATEAEFVLRLIAEKDYEVYFWNVPILARALSQAAGASLKPWLFKLIESDEFWRYVHEEERGENPLPVKLARNLYLFKRLVGVALANSCDQSDWQVLKRLVFHEYWPIRMAAAETIAAFGALNELNELVEAAQRAAADEPDQGVMEALRLLDWKLYQR